MIYAMSGIIIGMVMGLTGAGGALVAIPLFMQLMGMSLKDASVYSLVAVVIASLSNFINQRASTNYKLGLIIVALSSVGSFISAPFKSGMPEFVMAVLLIVISLYALYAIWFEKKNKQTSDMNLAISPVLLSIPVGLILGSLTTFTGLGGGVLMVPVLLKFYRFGQAQAVATSLFAVALSSMASLLVQARMGFQLHVDRNFIFLLLGILAAAMVIKQMLIHLPAKATLLIRKIIFTIVVALAIAKIIT